MSNELKGNTLIKLTGSVRYGFTYHEWTVEKETDKTVVLSPGEKFEFIGKQTLSKEKINQVQEGGKNRLGQDISFFAFCEESELEEVQKVIMVMIRQKVNEFQTQITKLLTDVQNISLEIKPLV